MTVVVFGAGAVGSLFAARFVGAGRDVVLVGRPEHVRAIERGGLRVEGVASGTFRCRAASRIPSGLSPEAMLLTVKTFDLDAAARELASSVPPSPLLLPQNGVGIRYIARRSVAAGGWADPDRWLVRCVHSVPATWVEPGVVRAAGTGEVVLPAPDGAGAAAGAASLFAELFRAAGFDVRTVGEIDREVWRKVAVNAAINPVTAIHRVPNGELARGPLRAEAERLLREAVAVAHAVGFALPLDAAEGDLERVVAATAGNRSSMLQDLDRGRPTEIDAISGAIVRLAEQHGVNVPATRSALAAVRAAASRRGTAAQPS